MKSQTPRTRKALYESLFDNMLDGLAYCQMIFDTQKLPVDFRYIQVNKNFTKLTGLKEVKGKKVTELIPGIRTSNPELLEIYGRVALTGKAEQFETYVKSLARWLLVSVYSPEKEFFIAVFQNITERKQLENKLENAKTAARNVLEDLQAEKESLAQANAKDEAMLASIGDGVIATDQDGKVIVMNAKAEKLLGFTGRKILGEHFVRAVSMLDAHGHQVPDKLRPLTSALTSGKSTTTTTTTTYYFVRKDGTKFPVAITATPITLAAKPTGAIVVFRDVTRDREFDQMRTDFLNVAAHDLRTPISAIKGYVWMIRQGDFGQPPAGEIGEALAEIENSADRMISLVRDFLTTSRIEQGRLKLTITVIDVAAVIKKALREVAVFAKNRPTKLVTKIKPDLPPVMADGLKIIQVLVNILDNAFRHTREGAITVTAAQSPTEPEFIRITVLNTGAPIPSGDLPHLFQRYYRGKNKAVGPGRGGSLGLGLYIVKMIIEKHGGRVWAENKPGRGVAFHFTLPTAK